MEIEIQTSLYKYLQPLKLKPRKGTKEKGILSPGSHITKFNILTIFPEETQATLQERRGIEREREEGKKV